MCFILLDTFSGLWVTMMATLQWPTENDEENREKWGSIGDSSGKKVKEMELIMRSGLLQKLGNILVPHTVIVQTNTHIPLFVSPNEHMTRTNKYVIQKHQQKWTNIVVIYCIIWLISIDLVYMRPMIYCMCIFIAYACTVYIYNYCYICLSMIY